MLRVRGDEDASAFGVGVWQSTPARAIRKRQRGRFCPYLFDFSRRTSEADYGICGIDPKVSRPGIPFACVHKHRENPGRLHPHFPPGPRP